MERKAYIIRTGTANLASVIAALVRAGWDTQLVESPKDVEHAGHLILPGVGTLGAAMRRLYQDQLVDALKERLQAGRPTLAVCLGLQLLAETSEESIDGERGLGIFPGCIRRFPDTVLVPQLGWNRVEPKAGQSWLQPGDAYFANSYCLAEDPKEGWYTAWADHGIPFVAAIARGRVMACQFHPELSGEWGRNVLTWWLEGGIPC